jgi:hypothetical protein
MLLAVTAGLVFGQKYTGPKPPKPDVLYLLHADNLIPVEIEEAKQETKKSEVQASVNGTTSPTRTPLAEPIFILEAEKIQPTSLELYKFDTKNGRREVTLSQKRTRGGPRPLRLSVTKLEGKLYKIEVDEQIENGQYGISPNGSNLVFCFEVY